MSVHGPESSYFTPYCSDCDTTFLFLEKSWPGDRTSVTLRCPTCGRELGSVEEETTLLCQGKGNIGDRVFALIPPETRRNIDRETKDGEQELPEHEGSGKDTPVVPSAYPGPQPSEVTDEYWVRTNRKKGEYPKDTADSGKWLIFCDLLSVDTVWAKIKQATEEGKLGSSAKVATARPNSNAADPRRRVICVYTYNWKDEQDTKRIREELRNLGIIQKIPYKADRDTSAGKYQVSGHRNISKYYE